MNIMTIMLISVSALAEPRAQRRVAFEGILGGQFNKHIHSYDVQFIVMMLNLYLLCSMLYV